MPRKVDTNQSEIVAALREVGATVCDIHEVAGGCPDLLVGFRGVNHLLEVKAPGSERRMTRLEVEWIENWRGPVAVVSTVEQALDMIGAGWKPEHRDMYIAMEKERAG